MKALLKETPLIFQSIVPSIYLWFSWSALPDIVPLHYNLQGEVDRYGDKDNLIWLVFLPLVTYFILLLAKKIDPKKRISMMGEKYYTIRFIMALLISAIFMLLIFSQVNNGFVFQDSLMIVLGLLFVLLGNYLKSMKPNYFIGFRTPWTLENENVWRYTHRVCSPIWLFGGLILIILNIISSETIIRTLSFSVIVLLVIIPFFVSYYAHVSINKSTDS